MINVFLKQTLIFLYSALPPVQLWDHCGLGTNKEVILHRFSKRFNSYEHPDNVTSSLLLVFVLLGRVLNSSGNI